MADNALDGPENPAFTGDFVYAGLRGGRGEDGGEGGEGEKKPSKAPRKLVPLPSKGRKKSRGDGEAGLDEGTGDGRVRRVESEGGGDGDVSGWEDPWGGHLLHKGGGGGGRREATGECDAAPDGMGTTTHNSSFEPDLGPDGFARKASTIDLPEKFVRREERVTAHRGVSPLGNGNLGGGGGGERGWATQDQSPSSTPPPGPNMLQRILTAGGKQGMPEASAVVGGDGSDASGTDSPATAAGGNSSRPRKLFKRLSTLGQQHMKPVEQTRDDAVLAMGMAMSSKRGGEASRPPSLDGNGLNTARTLPKHLRNTWDEQMEKEAEAMNDGEADSVFLLSSIDARRRWWDVAMLVMLLWTLLIVPLSIAFYENIQDEESVRLYLQSPERVMNIIVDTFFMLDILLNWCTVPLVRGVLSFDQKDVVANYLRGWFWIDLAGSVPYDIILLGTMDNSDGLAARFAKLGRFGKFLRFVRVVRMLRLTRLLHNAWEVSRISLVFFRGVRMILGVLLSSHVLACGFYAMSDFADPGEVSWVDRWSHADHCPQMSLRGCDTSYKYLVSYYWAITTLNTVGYGDITPSSSSEMAYTIAVVCYAGWLFASIVANIADTVEMESYTTRMQTHFLSEVKMWAHNRDLPQRVVLPIERQMGFVVGTSASLMTIERSVLAELPVSLRIDLSEHLYLELLSSCPFFAGRTRAFIAQIALRLHPLYLAGESLIYAREEPCELIYFLVKGQVAIRRYGKQPLIVEKGGWFGLLSLLGSTGQWTEDAMALANCEMWVLSQDDLYEVAEKPENAAVLTDLQFLASWHEQGLLGAAEATRRELCPQAERSSSPFSTYMASFEAGGASSVTAAAQWEPRGTKSFRRKERGKDGLMYTVMETTRVGKVANVVGIGSVLRTSSHKIGGLGGPSGPSSAVDHLRSLVQGTPGENIDINEEGDESAMRSGQDGGTLAVSMSRSSSRKALKDQKGVSMGRSATKGKLQKIIKAKVTNPLGAVMAFKAAGRDANRHPIVPANRQPSDPAAQLRALETAAKPLHAKFFGARLKRRTSQGSEMDQGEGPTSGAADAEKPATSPSNKSPTKSPGVWGSLGSSLKGQNLDAGDKQEETRSSNPSGTPSSKSKGDQRPVSPLLPKVTMPRTVSPLLAIPRARQTPSHHAEGAVGVDPEGAGTNETKVPASQQQNDSVVVRGGLQQRDEVVSGRDVKNHGGGQDGGGQAIVQGSVVVEVPCEECGKGVPLMLMQM